jgi:hypothetical protein
MAIAVEFADVEAACRTWLRSAGSSAGARVYFNVPDKDPTGPWVTVNRVGGGPLQGTDAPTDAARVSFSCWGGTKFQAQQLSAEVSSAVFALKFGDTMGSSICCAAELLSVLWAPDPVSNTPRYLVDATIMVRSQS